MSIRSISKELQQTAQKQLNEDVARIPEDIKYIKDWLQKAKYINARTDDQWILGFLRGSKFSLERCKEKIEMYYTMRTLAPEFYSNRDPMLPMIQHLLKLGVYFPLPKVASPDAPRVIIIRPAMHDPSKVPTEELFKVILMSMDILLNEDDQLIIAGEIAIQDMQNLGMAHVPSSALMKKSMTIVQDAYPFRPKASSFLNAPSIFEGIFTFIKPLMSEKIRNRITIHSSKNINDFYKTFPKHLMPKEYGGDGQPVQELIDSWKHKVESYRDWFLEEEQYKTNEKKRPGRPKTSDEYFGIEGSFRKLNVD